MDLSRSTRRETIHTVSKGYFQHSLSSKICLAVFLEQCLLYFPMACLGFKYLFSVHKNCYDGKVKIYLLLSNLSSAIHMSQKVFKYSAEYLMTHFYILSYFSRKPQLVLRSHLNLSNILYSNFPWASVYIYYIYGYIYAHANKARQIYTLEVMIYQNITYFKASQTIFIDKSNFSSFHKP